MTNIVLPSKERAAQQFESISKNLFESYRYLLDITDNQSAGINVLLDASSETKKATPYFFSSHHFLSQYFAHKNASIEPQLIKKILETEKIPIRKNMYISEYGDEQKNNERSVIEEALISDQLATFKSAKPTPEYTLHSCSSPERYQCSKEMLLKAMDVIKAADIDIFEEANYVVDEIRIFNAENIRAGSGFNTLGLIYVGEFKKDDDVSRYVEHIVHEAAHNLLYAYWANDPLIIDETDELFTSPLRRTDRPLSAIYHAMFVLSRTVLIFDRIYNSTTTLIDFSKVKINYNERKSSTPFKEKFLQTVDVIRKNAILSETGTSLLEGCIDIVNQSRIYI